MNKKINNMRDLLYLTFFSIMGIIGLIIMGTIFIGTILYYPIWYINSKDKLSQDKH